MKNGSYKTLEKWWLGLVVLFYVLYNVPGFPAYGDAQTAVWHGALTLVPLWVISYVGLFKLHAMRKIKKAPARTGSAAGESEGM